MSDNSIDLVAASRISRRVDLKEIRLSEVHASCNVGSGSRRLVPSYDYSCVPTKVDQSSIEVACTYNFRVHSSEIELASAKMIYLVVYALLGDDPAEEADIGHFAQANGAYHTWPFVRETIYGLTAKMGFPPYTLPVLSFLRPKPEPKQMELGEAKSSEPTESPATS